MHLESNWEPWPPLHLDQWKATLETLHRWMQVAGKVVLCSCPPMNHYWQVAFHVTARGLRSAPVPFGTRTFDLAFDFIDHQLSVAVSDGRRQLLPLFSRSVADFHDELLSVLGAMGIDVHIWPMPVEIPGEHLSLAEDTEHITYDPLAANRFYRVLVQADQVMRQFMSRFTGKQSPSHFFWGSFDLAQTRFSGRLAPLPPDADKLRRESYSRELMSFGFWPGTEGITDAAFYAYAVPQPPGFSDTAVLKDLAIYEPGLGEFLLPYEAVRQSDSPKSTVLAFFQSAYDAGATLGKWNREMLDRPVTEPFAASAAETLLTH